ncbi:hypothetical protein C0992_008592, partial [Termitomyces sp. T32_za158]
TTLGVLTHRRALPRHTIHKDVRVPPDSSRDVRVFLEHADLVRHGARAQLRNTQSEVQNLREGEGREELRVDDEWGGVTEWRWSGAHLAEGGDYEPDGRGFGWVEPAVGD